MVLSMEELTTWMTYMTRATIIAFALVAFVGIYSFLEVASDKSLMFGHFIVIAIFYKFKVVADENNQRELDLESFQNMTFYAYLIVMLSYFTGRISQITEKFAIYDQSEIQLAILPFVDNVTGTEIKSPQDWKSQTALLNWEPERGLIGHASLLLVNRAYISGWPTSNEDQTTIKAILKPMRRNIERTLGDDIREEGRYPNSVILFPEDIKLNYEEMMKEWEHIKNTPYMLSRGNCAQTVHRILEAGGLRIRQVMGDAYRFQWLFLGPGILKYLVSDTIIVKSKIAAGWVAKLIVITTIVVQDFISLNLLTAVIQTAYWCYRWKTYGSDGFDMTIFRAASRPLVYHHVVKIVGFYFLGETSRIEFFIFSVVISIVSYFILG
ncbi:uncharacterized protein LOC110848693 isoform X1 [Folsomia candida]|uniref:Uncharacterized protein n=1 Tax=Folsomia candida TaxID=158441 RepID=A0A226ECQ8_FOLCA|nr:uncharacterized protein LOC110848693 isoform X1 [Folsomia candida]XP_021951654.1 uncharacterized protein LOC110848693 isoform X1 [Folsomia candida]OXA55365.1 hypothetical protein Fcan01_08906 [Folsomia candida]